MSDELQTKNDIEQIPDSWLWIKNSKGEASVSVTFLTIAFFVTTVLYILSAFVKIGPIELRAFDSAACSVYFIPLASLYFGRRYTESKFNDSSK